MEADSQTFTLTLTTGNATMQTTDDIAEALAGVAAKLRAGQTGGNIRDANGNAVGAFHLYHWRRS